MNLERFDVGCLPEFVEHGRTGWLAKSPDDLAALIRAAGRIDPRECREQAARRFTPAVMADLYEQLISGLVPPGRSSPFSNQGCGLPGHLDRPADVADARA
jgi:hypothetical protein